MRPASRLPCPVPTVAAGLDSGTVYAAHVILPASSSCSTQNTGQHVLLNTAVSSDLSLQKGSTNTPAGVSIDLGNPTSRDPASTNHGRFKYLPCVLQSGENTDRHTLRLWLISAASKLEEVQPSRTWGRLEPLLRTGNDSRDTNPAFGIYLLQLVCDVERTKVKGFWPTLQCCFTVAYGII